MAIRENAIATAVTTSTFTPKKAAVDTTTPGDDTTTTTTATSKPPTITNFFTGTGNKFSRITAATPKLKTSVINLVTPDNPRAGISAKYFSLFKKSNTQGATNKKATTDIVDLTYSPPKLVM